MVIQKNRTPVKFSNNSQQIRNINNFWYKEQSPNVKITLITLRNVSKQRSSRGSPVAT